MKDAIYYIGLDEKYRSVKKWKIDENDKNSRYETNDEADKRFDNELNELYEVYKEKLINGVYKNRSESISKQVVDNQDVFLSLSLYEKAYLLKELTKLFSNIATTNADLRYINGSKTQGTFVPSKNITDKKVILQTESITGLFVNRMEL